MCNVNIVTGEVTQSVTDFFLPGIIPLHFVRKYSSMSRRAASLGFGWTHNLDISLMVSQDDGLLTYDNGRTVALPLPPVAAEIPAWTSTLTVARTVDLIVIAEADRNRLFFVRPMHPSQAWLLARKEDAYGNAIRFAYDSQRRLIGLVDTLGRLVSFQYDQRGRLIEVRLGPSDRSTTKSLVTYGFDDADDLVAVVDGSRTPCRYAYHDHLLTCVTNRIGGHLYYQYDRERRGVRTWRDGGTHYREIRYHPARLTTAVTDSRGYTTLYRSNGKGFTEEEVDPVGRMKRDVYDAEGNLLLNNSAAGGLQEVFVRDKSSNLVRLITNSGEVRFQLNSMQQPVSITNAEGKTSQYEYDHAGSLTRSVSPRGAVWGFSYDRHGRLERTVDPLGHDVAHRRTENPTTVTDEDALGVLARRVFDFEGRLVAFENGSGHRTTIQYDQAGNPATVTYPDGSQESYTYDAEGNTLSFTDGTGLTTRYEYDLNHSLVAIIDPRGARLSLQYDTEENLIAVTNTRGERAELVYNELGQQIQTSYFDGTVERYEYDDRDRLIRIRTEQGEPIVDLAYDDANRLVSKKWADGKEVRIGYGSQNQIVSMAGADMDLEYEWDADNQITSERIGDVLLTSEYDLAGNRVALRTSQGREIRYDWDLRGRLVRIADSQRHVYEYSYNPSGCITEARLPSGLVQRFDYDRLDRMVGRAVIKDDGTTVTRRSFQYDGQSRVSATQDSHRGSVAYRYDDQEHVVDVIKDGQLAEHYDYDGEDNLLAKRDGSPVVLDSGSRVIRAGADQYRYDAFGNLIAKRDGTGEVRYEYNLDGQLVRVRDSRGDIFEFLYDPTGRRVAKLHNGRRTSFLWDGVALLEERIDGGQAREFLFMPGSFFPVGQTQEGEHYSYSFDQLGTATDLFDSRGESAWGVEYTAFGEVRSVLHARVESPFRFLGQYSDAELGLSYTRYRYYDPELGRFTSPDPIRLSGGPNLYRYVINPLNWVDPFGLAPCVLRPKCSWSKKQQADFQMKAKQWQDLVDSRATGIRAKEDCEARKVAKDIYNDCRDNKGYEDKLPKLIETSSKCSNQQADHKREVIAKGKEKDCDNLQPLNESVNKSIGSTIGKCLGKAPITSITIITSMVPGKKTGCRPGGKKCPDLD